MSNHFQIYFKALQAHSINEITEHSHRSSLQQLIQSVAYPPIQVLHEPKRVGKFGAPDFKITHTESIIGYIENKKIEENLDNTLKSEQIKKYQVLSDNILLTNYIEWIWLKNGNVQQREALCFQTDIEDKRKKLNSDKALAVEKLIKSFLSQAPKAISSAKKLAEALAKRAKMLKEILHDILEIQKEEEKHQGRLYQLFETFQNFVFQELTIEEFADTFAQNLVYGLFLAKLNADKKLINLYNAKKYIPLSFSLIRELVNFLDELDNEDYLSAKWIVEEVLTIMNNLDLEAIKNSLSFTKEEKDVDNDNIIIKDPYVYFYEDFLAAYDKKLRKSKGVYYTPPPVVNFMVRTINDILKKSFKIKDGLADRKSVTLLDFATGTGTFLIEVLQQIFEQLPKDSGKKDLLIKEHILKNIFGFEYLLAPYTITHLKLSQFLRDNGYELQGQERLQIFLTNTLSPIDLQQKIPLLPALTEESKQAQKIKDRPILVITGNPPYSKKSKNNDPWIVNLVNNYKYIDGVKSRERQNWFRDDYIKFIRFAQHKMDEVDEGIVAIITNHTFLLNVTMPGMRQSLLQSFNQIYIVNLNGSDRLEANLPENYSKDENVFDQIQQGVAISFFIKRKGLKRAVYYTDFWGSRKEKYLRCLDTNIESIDWIELEPKSPDYYFIPRDETHKKQYETFYSVADIFKVYSLPLMTGRNPVTIRFTKNEIKRVLKVFTENDEEEIRETLSCGNDSRDWKVANAKADIISTKASEDYIKEITWRPFDTRFTYYTGKSKGFHASPSVNVCKHMLYKNIGLLLPRQISKIAFRHVFCTRLIPEMCGISSATKEQNQLFPLYIYSNSSSDIKREENFTENFRKFIDEKYGEKISPEQIFGYIYAVLHSPTYRSKYSEFLGDKFARIPFTDDKKLFLQISKLGTKLTEVHLLETATDSDIGNFIGRGSYLVDNVKFIEKENQEKIIINSIQYFDNTPKNVWEFQIGGYMVIKKFLTARKSRKLSLDEVEKMTSIINAIAFTLEQIEKIDNITKSWI